MRLLRGSGHVQEAAYVAAVLRIDPVAHLRDADEWSRAARVAAEEIIADARREANERR